jgi:hypothetical protein
MKKERRECLCLSIQESERAQMEILCYQFADIFLEKVVVRCIGLEVGLGSSWGRLRPINRAFYMW